MVWHMVRNPFAACNRFARFFAERRSGGMNIQIAGASPVTLAPAKTAQKTGKKCIGISTLAVKRILSHNPLQFGNLWYGSALPA